MAAFAEVYRWVDKEGKVQYSDVPPPDAKVQTRKLTDNSIDVDKVPYEMRELIKNTPLVFYSSPDFKEASDAGRDLLKRRKLPFTERSVKTADDAKEIGKQLGKVPMVPALSVGKQVIEGFNNTSWNNALDAAGYPKALNKDTKE